MFVCVFVLVLYLSVVTFQLFVVVLCLCAHFCVYLFHRLVVILCLFLVLCLFVVFCFPLCGLSVSFQVFFISAWLFCVFLWSSCILCGHASLCTLMDSRQEMSTVAPKDPGLCPVGLLLSNPTKVVPQVWSPADPVQWPDLEDDAQAFFSGLPLFLTSIWKSYIFNIFKNEIT